MMHLERLRDPVTINIELGNLWNDVRCKNAQASRSCLLELDNGSFSLYLADLQTTHDIVLALYKL